MSLSKLDRHQSKASKGHPPGSPSFLSELPVDDWVPSWVGSSFDPSKKAQTIESWKNKLQGHQSVECFISCLTTFWLSHAAVGIVRMPTVFSFILLILKMISEHDLQYAMGYVRQLQQNMLTHVKMSESASLDSCLIAL